MEKWKDINGYCNKYEISNLGKVKSKKRNRLCKVNGGSIAKMTINERILKPWKRGNYLLIDLWENGKRDTRSIHSLVYTHFNGAIKENYVVHHIDGNKLNNNYKNLECVSCKTHNKIHHGGRPSWNKGKKMPPEPFIKMWETRRKKSYEK